MATKTPQGPLRAGSQRGNPFQLLLAGENPINTTKYFFFGFHAWTVHLFQSEHNHILLEEEEEEPSTPWEQPRLGGSSLDPQESPGLP